MPKLNIILPSVVRITIIVLFYSNIFLGVGLCQGNKSDSLSRNTFYVDLASKGAFYSINYDRTFHKIGKLSYSYRIGLSILDDALALPIGINFFTGKKKSHAEFSLTVIPYIDHRKSFLSKNDLSDKYIYIVPGIGYRYQKSMGGLFFKAVISPLVFLDPPSNDFWNMNPKVYLAGNIGIGLSF